MGAAERDEKCDLPSLACVFLCRQSLDRVDEVPYVVAGRCAGAAGIRAAARERVRGRVRVGRKRYIVASKE